MIRIVHENGSYTVGPVRDDENWIKQNFKDLSDHRKIVKHGYGLDIDSYGNNIDVPDEKTLISKVSDTLKLSKSIEDAIIRSLES